MPRSKIYGYISVLFSVALAASFAYAVFFLNNGVSNFADGSMESLNNATYCAVALPIGLISLSIIGTGFWIGWTILTIKVVPPMPEIVEKKDYSKIQAFFLCLATFITGALIVYGILIKNFWALAIPAAAITLVILGAVFGVGIAIITTRATLSNDQKEN